MPQDTSDARRQVVVLLPEAPPPDGRTVQVSSAEGVHQFGVDLISTASEAGLGAVSAPLVADLNLTLTTNPNPNPNESCFLTLTLTLTLTR